MCIRPSWCFVSVWSAGTLGSVQFDLYVRSQSVEAGWGLGSGIRPRQRRLLTCIHAPTEHTHTRAYRPWRLTPSTGRAPKTRAPDGSDGSFSDCRPTPSQGSHHQNRNKKRSNSQYYAPKNQEGERSNPLFLIHSCPPSFLFFPLSL